jgi:transposase
MAELVAARSWLTIYQLPPHAHELNPVEPVWSHLVGPTGRNKSLRGPASAQAGFPAASGDG